MARQYGNGRNITVISISDKLGVSKIYLEQVFSLLKRGGVVSSAKGAQGGYCLTRTPQKITAFDILSSVELSLFEVTEETVKEKAPETESAMRADVFDALDGAVRDSLSKITLNELVARAEKYGSEQGYMFYL